MKDIANVQDIDLLVEKFYEKVSKNPVLLPYFGEVNWAMHLPIMKGFWQFILLNIEGSYTRNVMNPHIHLHEQMPLSIEAFQEWVKLFTETVNSEFSGEVAQKAIETAKSIALTMQYKLNLNNNSARTGLTITKAD